MTRTASAPCLAPCLPVCLTLCLALLFAGGVAAHAQGAGNVVDAGRLPLDMVDLNDGWRMHSGDDAQWAEPKYDANGWLPVTLGPRYRIPSEWTWYRLTLKLPPAGEPLALLVRAPEGTLEAYVDGQRAPGNPIGSWLRVYHSGTQVVPLPRSSGIVTIALRTHFPKSLAVVYTLSLSARLGGLSSAESAANGNDRGIDFVASAILNLFLLLGGIGALALSRVQRGHREYLWLGIFLLLAVVTTAPWQAVYAGLVPLWVNSLICDPLAWAMYAALIQFLFAFLGRTVGPLWRLAQAALLAVIPVAILAAEGVLSSEFYWTFEGFAFLALSLAMPVFLLTQYFSGKREAGWLILPTALVSATIAQDDVGTVADAFHLHIPLYDFFMTFVVYLGPIPVSYTDMGNFLFLLAIGVVMFFRFTQISSDQARAAAEMEAARVVQQVIIPETLPSVPGFRIEAVYKPVGEVGGDFFQVLAAPAGGLLAVIGDVSGKGMPAAMTVSLLVGTFRTLAHFTQSPTEILTAMNQRMLARSNGGFTTCLVLRIEKNNTLIAANAGHLLPYLDCKEIALDCGLPLGLSSESTYAESTMQLPPNAQLTLLTDGVLEAHGKTGELFGFDRTAAISAQPAEVIARAAQQFGQDDDITVLTLTRLLIAEPATPQLMAHPLSSPPA